MLELKNISFRYKKTQLNVLEDINCNFEQGKLYGIIGKSGSGKTTLISLISGLDKPSCGDIYYNSVNIRKLNLNTYRSKNIGVIFQSYNLLLKWTVLDNVLISLFLKKINTYDRKRMAYEILEKVGITGDKCNRTILHLSGGEQQRVAIARAVAGNPDIIMADEPTGNLDIENQIIIMDILHNFAVNDNKCIIVASHSNIITEYADTIVKINNGRIEI